MTIRSKITATLIGVLLISGCVKDSQYNKNNSKKIRKNSKLSNYELDFNIQNLSGKTVYVACFSYIKKHDFARWRWDKSKIYKLENNQSMLIDIDNIKDKEYRENVYGALAVFNNKQDALNSTYEHLNENNRLDLDKLYLLKNKTVKIGVEKYGFKGDLFTKELVQKIKTDKKKYKELDFLIKNKTGKTLYLCGFIYQKKINSDVWTYDKTKVKKIKPNQIITIDVDTLKNEDNRSDTRGFLGIFKENQKEIAEKSTYELLAPENKLALGRLASLKNKLIVLEIERYGIQNNFLEFSIKPHKPLLK